MSRPRKLTKKSGFTPIQFRSLMDAMDTQAKAIDGFRQIHESRKNPEKPEALGSIGIAHLISVYAVPRVYQLIESGFLNEESVARKLGNMDDDAEAFFDRLALLLADEFDLIDRQLEALSDPESKRLDGILARRCAIPVREMIYFAAMLHVLDRVMMRRWSNSSMPRRRHTDAELTGYNLYTADVESKRMGTVALPNFSKKAVDYVLRNHMAEAKRKLQQSSR